MKRLEWDLNQHLKVVKHRINQPESQLPVQYLTYFEQHCRRKS